MKKKIKDKLLQVRSYRKKQIADIENSLIKIMKDDIQYVDNTIKGNYPVKALLQRFEQSNKWIKTFFR